MKTSTAENMPAPSLDELGDVVPIRRGRVGSVVREALVLVAIAAIGMVGAGAVVAHGASHQHLGCSRKAR